MSLSVLEQSVLKTLAYFDISNYPLTKEELYACLWQSPGFAPAELCHGKPEIEYVDFLEELRIAPIETKMGYYFLPGRSDIVENRRKKLLISDLKLKIARKAAKKIRPIPFLKAIFVCNSVGAELAGDDSDIDFLIVTTEKRIWIVRFFCNLILRILGLRTYGSKTKNKICLSFFVDENNLDLSSYRIIDEDIHFAYWIGQMFPVYDPDNFYSKFLSANSWVKKFLSNSAPAVIGTERLAIGDSKVGFIWKKSWEKIWAKAYGDLIEAQARALQLAKLKLSVKNKSEAGGGVVINDQIIKLHENDTRRDYFEKWEKLVSKICL